MDRDRPSAVLADDELRLRASAVGSCVKGLAWVARGGERTPPPSFVQAAMDESSSLEGQAMDLLCDRRALSSSFDEASPRESLVLRDLGVDVWLEGCTDFFHEGLDQFVEIKTVSEATLDELVSQFQLPWRDRSGLAVKYTWQLKAYEVLYGPVPVLGLVEKDKFVLTGRAEMVTDEFRPSDDEFLERIGEILDLAVGAVGDEPLVCAGQSGWCEAEVLCKPEPAVLDVDIDLNLISVLKAKADAAHREHREALDALAEKVKEVGGRAVTPDGHKMTWVETHVVEKQPREYDRRYLKITRRRDAKNHDE